ncbi:transposase [Mycolicibacterium sp.]
MHLASWAGTAPGCIESAGKVQLTKTRHGNRYLKGALGLTALAASRSKGNLTRCQPHRLPGGT